MLLYGLFLLFFVVCYIYASTFCCRGSQTKSIVNHPWVACWNVFKRFLKADCSFWLLSTLVLPQACFNTVPCCGLLDTGIAGISLYPAIWDLFPSFCFWRMYFFLLHLLQAGSCPWPWSSSCGHPTPLQWGNSLRLFYFVKKLALELGYESLLDIQACLFKIFFKNLCLGSESHLIRKKKRKQPPPKRYYVL